MKARAGGDRGVATVWAAGAIAVLVSVAVFGLHLGEAMVVRHRAEAAADLAALAAAARAVPGERYACAQARRITGRMRVQLVSCSLHGWDALISVAAQPAGWLGTLGSATAHSRAGPTPPLPRYGDISVSGGARAPRYVSISGKEGVSRVLRTTMAPGLSSGSLPLPHLGD